MRNYHECPGLQKANEPYELDVIVEEDGIATFEYDNSGDVWACFDVKFNYCPFCGVALPITESLDSTVRLDCNCNNTYNGICMDCGRSTQ